MYIPLSPWLLLALPLAGILYVGYLLIWTPYRALLELQRQGVPTMPFRPYFGQLPEFQRSARLTNSETEPGVDDAKFVYVFREWEKKYGSIIGMCFGPIPRLHVGDPSLVREILFGKSDNFPKHNQQKVSLTLLGNGLVNSNGSLWHRQRRMLNPSFGQNGIKKMFKVMNECTEKLISRWRDQVDDAKGTKEIEVHYDLSALALDIIGRSAFGANIEGGSKEAEEIAQAVAKYLENIIKRILSGLLFIPGYLWLPTELNRTISRSELEVRKLCLKLIRKRREAHAKGEVGDDLLSSMLFATDDETNKGMTNQQLVDESVTFLFAGHETTAQLVTWTMYLLALHPEWQERVREESLKVIGPRQQLDWGHLSSLTDLHLVLQESMRLFPPVPLISRAAENDLQLGPYRVPKGTLLGIPIGLLHRKKEIWGEDADEFRPLRFADGAAKACKDTQMYIPFSSGPRNCIGQAFALTEGKVIMAEILRNFSWKLSPGFKLSIRNIITLRPKNGMPLIFTKVES